MSLKRPRIHFSGISNKDFRTKGETVEIKKYQPFHESKNFGMLGLANYKLPLSMHKELFGPTKGINERKFIDNDVQNPKIYETALFYQQNYMKIKPKALIFGERGKQLDTTDHRGGLPYNGDSMMIVETNNLRKEIKIKQKLFEENLKKRHIGVISGGIMRRHELNTNIKNDTFSNSINNDNINNETTNKSNAETQVNNNIKEKKLYKSISDYNCLDKKVSKERLNMIKNKINNRLITHKNTKAIFINWQKNYLNNRELSVYDLHKIINDLGIPINYNETFALIKSANKRNTDKLNYDEFKSLLLNDEKKIDLDLSKIPYKNESLFEDNNKKENENKNTQLNDLKISQNENYFAFQKIMRTHYPNFLQTMKKYQNENEKKYGTVDIDGLCSLSTFKKVLDSLKIDEKFKNESIINTIYNQYKISGNDLMNYDKFIENCKNINETNDFFIFQNKYLDLIQKKLTKNEEERKKYKDILLEDQKRKKDYLQNLYSSFDSSLEEIKNNKKINKSRSSFYIKLNKISCDINKNKQYSLEKEQVKSNNSAINALNQIRKDNIYEKMNYNSDNNTGYYNHYQPSLNFINDVFKDNKMYNDRYYKAIDEISPLIPKKTSDINELMKKNFSDLDEKKYQMLLNSRKFNKKLLSCEIGMPGYIDDEERYKRNEISEIEKKRKLLFFENTLKRKYNTNKKWNDNINFQQRVIDINNSLGQIKRTDNLYRYEQKINHMNIAV